MANSQNTPPLHAELQITITRHANSVLQDARLDIRGCNGCIVEAIASYLVASQPFKELINKAVRIANERKQQKEN